MAQINQHGAWNMGNSGVNSVNLDPYTYNPRYPWFDEANYRKLESKIDALWLTWYEKEKAMDEAYLQILPLVQNEIKNSDRREEINQKKYEASQIQDPEQKIMANGKMNVMELTQNLKETFNIDPSAPDEEVFNDRIKSIPNGWELLANYMTKWDRELLYAWGLAEKVEAPETPESSVWGIQSLINQQSEMEWNDKPLNRAYNVFDRANLPWKVTQWVDGLVQKIPVATYSKQVENLANKMNNLTEDEYADLYQRYTNMIRNWLDKKWNDDERGIMELLWDGVMWWDQDALDRVNSLYLYDYSDALKQDGIERNSWGTNSLNKALWTDLDTLKKYIDENELPWAVKGIAKWTVWTADKLENLLNFVGRSYWALENYAEALGVWLQKLDDIRDMRYVQSSNVLENDEDAFTAYVADRVANFGEYMTDAPDTLLGKPTDPNVVKFFSNIPQSFVKLLSWQVRAKTNKLDTKVWLLNLLFTDEWQQALLSRYGTPDALANTMNTDPVWLADDLIDMADKFNMVTNKATWWAVDRKQIGSVTDAWSDSIVNWGNMWTSRVKWEDGEYLKDEEWNYVLKNNDISGINQWLNNLSNWFRDKWWNRTANFVDLERKATSADPVNEIKKMAEDPNKYAREVWQTAREIYDTANPLNEDTKAWFRERANRKVQNINRMNKTQQEEFVKMSWGVDQGEFQNQRWLRNLDDLSEYLTNNLKQVDDAMDAIEGRFKSNELNVVLDDVLKYATETEDPRLARIQELYNKNYEWEWGLEMKEINEIKRFYERTNIFDYLKDSTKGKQRRKATNRDTALRKWQQQVAADAWFDNLKELNKETQLTKYILDNAWDRKSWTKGNNDITLTDRIVASWGWLDINGIAALVGKKIYNSNWFQNGLVDVYNYIGDRQQIDLPKADMAKIQQMNQTRAELRAIDKAALAEELAKVQSQQDFQNWLDKAQAMAWPALPYNENVNNYNTIIGEWETIKVTPEWTSLREWQIAEIPNEVGFQR